MEACLEGATPYEKNAGAHIKGMLLKAVPHVLKSYRCGNSCRIARCSIIHKKKVFVADGLSCGRSSFIGREINFELTRVTKPNTNDMI